MTIHAIQYAQSTLPESMVLAGGDPQKQLDISFLLYVVETGDFTVLIDAGCDTMPGFTMNNFVSPASALKDYGIAPQEITDVIITHAHHDHIDGLRHFSGARIHIQSYEYQKASAYIPNTAEVHIFDKTALVADCIAVERIGGHTTGSSIASVHIGNLDYVFAGDECYLPVCLEQNIPTGASCNPDASAAFIARMRKSNCKVLLAHDTNIKTGIIERI